MGYPFQTIEKKWKETWAKNKVFRAEDFSEKPKYYVLDMFPYPSGAGLHVGHPLGYIASDVYARYKRHKGFNVLHPMGYDSFGLPAEQYAIQTGQHPKITTEKNIRRYREQLDTIGFSFDWSREVRTSDPNYYKWTQWIFTQLYDAWYNNKTQKAEPIEHLIKIFSTKGNADVLASHSCEVVFTADEWEKFDALKKESILSCYRLTYLADTTVNWCEELGTVLANDEVKDGKSERGGYPVVQKNMQQWIMRITAYAERLLKGLEGIDWPDALKEQQRNWIGKSTGAEVDFKIQSHSDVIKVYTTRPDTIFGVSFMVLAPEHPLVDHITTSAQKESIADYKTQSKLKSQRERQANVKDISGVFTGAYAIHPFTNKQIPIWISDYVLMGYGTGAIMAVPAGDQRDYDFAKHFSIDILEIFEGVSLEEKAYDQKKALLKNSDFLNGIPPQKAIALATQKIDSMGIGKAQTNYKLRDAVFSRQRYWGEPFPVYYENGIANTIAESDLPIELPDVDAYLPTKEGDPPLARAKKEDWKTFYGDKMEVNTMPGWAGSSWYYLRYMDPVNNTAFVDRKKADYWGQVDLYIGGSEHATGHLLYARFWCKFLYDIGFIGFEEPFKKLINQGMILGRSNFVYRDKISKKFVSFSKRKDYQTSRLHVDISLCDNDVLDLEKFKKWRKEYAASEFILEDDGSYLCGSEVEKMSKSKYNVQTPDELVERFGADTLRCYEMFLGPLEQAKPWDVKGINGVHNFLNKLWRLFYKEDALIVNDQKPNEASLKTLHKTIKKISEDLERNSFNTPISALMIAVNELTEQKCHSKEVLKDLLVLVSPFAPFIAEELYVALGFSGGMHFASWPSFNQAYLVERSIHYPVSFNGKMRFKLELPADLNPKEVEERVLSSEQAQKWLEGKTPKKTIVVPKKIVNVVV